MEFVLLALGIIFSLGAIFLAGMSVGIIMCIIIINRGN